MIRYEGFEHLLRSKAEDRGDAPALLHELHGEKAVLSYRGLYEKVLALADTYRQSGHRCLGILCDGSPECVLTIFASVFSGMQTVLLDENASDELLKEQVRETDVDCLWGDEDIREALSEELMPRRWADGPDAEDPVRPGQLLFFTSGTTGRSRAVILTDRSLMSSAWNGSCMLPLTEQDRLLCMLPLNHVFGFVCSLLWGLQCGACVALGRGARHFADDPAFFAPTAISVVPALLAFLLKYQCINPELRLVLAGAGDCPRAYLDAAAALGVQVSFGYGMTETSSGVAISTSGDPYALDICPDDTVTIAEDGEILIEAPTCVMQGYYRRKEATEEVLRGGILYSGDLGRLDENGRLHITGRKKDVLVLPDGSKIFLPEYESKLMQVLGTQSLAVLEVNGKVTLLLGLEDSGRSSDEPAMKKQIENAIRPVMADYPRGLQIRRICFTTSPLPRTAAGKLIRWELPGLVND